MIELLQKERVKSLAFDPLQVCVQEYQTLLAKLPKCALESLPNFQQQPRIIKSDKQVALITKSQKLNKKAYKCFAKMIKRTIERRDNPTELYLHALARQALEQDGSHTLSFNPILSLNANAAKPHALQ